MRKNMRQGLRLMEKLEARTCLSVAASVLGGNLVITGVADGDVQIVGSGTAGEFSVTDNATDIGSVTGVTKDIRVTLSSNGVGTNVDIDLGTQSVLRVRVNFVDGDNALTLSNGIARGGVFVRSGDGDDSVSLSDDLDVQGDVDIRLADGVNSVLLAGHVGRNVKVTGTDGDDSLTVAATAHIDRGISALLGNGDNTVTIEGLVGREISITTGEGDDTVDIGLDATLSRSISALLGDGDNTVNVNGAITKNVTITTLNGNDTVNFNVDSAIGGSTNIKLGDGDNTAQFDGTISGNLSVTSANVDDVFTVGETGVVSGTESLTPGEQFGGRHGHHHGGFFGFDFWGNFGLNLDKIFGQGTAIETSKETLGKITKITAANPYDPTGSTTTDAGSCKFGKGLVSIKPLKLRF